MPADASTLRRQLASARQVPEQAVDLIELRRANLTMRAAVAEEGVVLHGDNTLAWSAFCAAPGASWKTSTGTKPMRDDICHAETRRIAAEQQARLDQARQAMQAGGQLSLLEQGGVLHALQVLIENAIGKAKRMLKEQGHPVPVSAYDAFGALVTHGLLPSGM